jgi:hypothetical protein
LTDAEKLEKYHIQIKVLCFSKVNWLFKFN